MGLRARTFVTVALSLAILSMALYVTARGPLIDAFERLESQRASRDASRLRSALDYELAQLERTASDWAPRNATYAYMRGESKDLEAELTEDALTRLDVNLVMFVDENGALRHAISVDLGLGTAVEMDTEAIDTLLATPQLMKPGDPRANIAGFVRLPHRVMLVASRSITSSDQYAPPEGTFIIGRYFDEVLVDSLAEATGLSVTAYPMGDATLPTEAKMAVASMGATGSAAASPLDQHRMGVYALVRDIEGTPAVLLQATTARDVLAAGNRAIGYFGVVLLLFGAVATAAVAYVVDRSVLTRIANLSRQMARIALRADLSSRVSVSGTDEIATLAEDINDALSAIDESERELVSARDQLEVRVAERTEELRVSEQRYRTLVERMADAVFTTDLDGVITFANQRAAELVGVALHELEGRRLLAFLSPASQEELTRRTSSGLVRETPVTLEVKMGDPVHGAALVELRSVPLRDEFGQFAGAQWIARDVAERKRFEEQLVHMASHDYLTGLFNRQFFENALELELAESRRSHKGGGIIWLDVDDFKEVNDSLGHRAGDEVLVELSTRLRAEVRESTVLARLGGDEFGALMPNVTSEEAEAIAARILAGINAHTYSAGEHAVRLSASIGVVMYPTHGNTVEELLANADVAMYLAKASGRSCVHMHRVGEDWTVELKSRVAWNERLAAALREERFKVYAQPVLDLRTDTVVSHELLIRMVLDGEIVPPAEFLPAAERLGIIRDIDRWMVSQAIRLLEQDALGGTSLEVNLSGRAFGDATLLPAIEQALRESKVDPQRLGLEITETAAIADMAKAQQFITTLKELGCRFSLDDFGSGFSSFYYLKHLPIDCLKIDGSFIRGLPESEQDQHLVRGIVELCRGLRVEIAVEYVEDEETLEVVRDLGVDLAQGYHIGRPAEVSWGPDVSRVRGDEQ